MAMRVGRLDAPLLQLTPWDHFTLRHACQGVCIMGGIGSGKTSGSGQALVVAYLEHGFGGLVLCAKPEEAENFRQYCTRTGRTRSLIEWDGTNGGFNFLNWELSRHGSDGVNTVVETMIRILEIAKNASPMPTRPGEPFWEDTQRQILRSAIPVLHAATGTVRIADILEFVRSAPQNPQEMADPKWQQGSAFCRFFTEAAPQLDDELGARLVAYWRKDFVTLDPKTRGNIVISLTTALDRFNHGWLRNAFCGETTLVPELCFEGAVILLNMPALTKNEDGIIAQQLFKYLWQRAVLARNGLPDRYRSRPVFLWADEAQYFVNSFDAEFLSTGRGSLACTVFLSQSLPTYYAKMAGESGHDRVHHLLGNFATRVWHNNACAETNEWAAKTIGKGLQQRRTYNRGHGTSHGMGMNRGESSNSGGQSSSGGGSSYGQGGGSSNSSWSSGTSWGQGEQWGDSRNRGGSSNESWGHSEQMDYLLEPGMFSRHLKTGGPAHDNRVSAVWFQAGRTFAASNSNVIVPEFQQ